MAAGMGYLPPDRRTLEPGVSRTCTDGRGQPAIFRLFPWGDSASLPVMGKRAKPVWLTAVAAILCWFAAGQARAANNAYAVDAADISETGSCKIESWLSSATNTDFSAVANPSCVVDPLKL